MEACGSLEILILDGRFLKCPEVLDVAQLFGDALRNVCVLHVFPAPGFVQRINGLVGQGAVGDIAFGKVHAGIDGIRSVGDMVMVLVAVLDVLEDGDGVFGTRRLKCDALETTVKGSVLFNGLSELVDGGGSNALYLAACQGRFEDVCSVERTRSPSGTDDGMDFVDEENNLAVVLQFINEASQPFFKLSAVLCTSDERCHIQGNDAFVGNRMGNIPLDYPLCQSFDKGGFSDSGLSDEDGIVFLSSGKYLCRTLYFAATAYNGVEHPIACSLRKVGSEVVDDGSVAFCFTLFLVG